MNGQEHSASVSTSNKHKDLRELGINDKRRRRTLYILLGIGIAAISVGLVFLFTQGG